MREKYESLAVTVLRDLAKSRGIQGISAMKKADLVDAMLTLDEEEIVIVGSFPRLEEGLNYEFRGYMKEHQKYGEQFVVSSYAKSHSFTKDGLISYLSSDKFPGIGPKLASYIVLELGLTCIDLILDDPNVLDKVYGITKKKKEVINLHK